MRKQMWHNHRSMYHDRYYGNPCSILYHKNLYNLQGNFLYTLHRKCPCMKKNTKCRSLLQPLI